MPYEVRLLIVAIVWGLNYKILPVGVNALGAGPFTFWRFLASSIILMTILLGTRYLAVSWRDIPRLALVGLIGTTAYQGVFAAGVGRTDTVEAAMLFSLSPVFSMFLSTISGRERPKIHQVIGVVIATSGTYLIVMRSQNLSVSEGDMLGNGFMLLSAFLWALYAFLSEPLLKRLGGIRVTAWSAAFGTVGLAGLSWQQISFRTLDNLASSAIYSLLFAVLAATVFGVVVFYATVPHLGSRRVMTTMYLVPVVAILVDCVTNQTVPGGQELIGITLVFMGVVMVKASDLGCPRSFARLARVR